MTYAVEVDADCDRFPEEWLFHHRWGKKPGKVNGEIFHHNNLEEKLASLHYNVLVVFLFHYFFIHNTVKPVNVVQHY